MAKEEPLVMKLYFSRLYTEIARTVGYVGFPFRELAEKMAPLVKEYGAKAVSLALQEVAVHALFRTMLNPHARKLCFGMLGPPPERWDEFYRDVNGDPMPRPEGREVPPVIEYDKEPDPFLLELFRLTVPDLEKALEVSARRRNLDEVRGIRSELLRRGVDAPEMELDPEAEEEKPSPPGISPEMHARKAKKCKKRQLHCMLRDARKKLKHHGRHSFMGKEARKEIAAAEAELAARALPLPPEGEETAQWDKKKTKG